MQKFKTQTDAVNYLLLSGEKHSFLTMFKATGCSRFSARIFDLRAKGIKFDVETVKFKTRFGSAGKYNTYKVNVKATGKTLINGLLKQISENSKK